MILSIFWVNDYLSMIIPDYLQVETEYLGGMSHLHKLYCALFSPLLLSPCESVPWNLSDTNSLTSKNIFVCALREPILYCSFCFFAIQKITFLSGNSIVLGRTASICTVCGVFVCSTNNFCIIFVPFVYLTIYSAGQNNQPLSYGTFFSFLLTYLFSSVFCSKEIFWFRFVIMSFSKLPAVNCTPLPALYWRTSCSKRNSSRISCHTLACTIQFHSVKRYGQGSRNLRSEA